MGSQDPMRIGSILPGAIERVEQLAERVRERELAEAMREVNQAAPREWWHYKRVPRSVEELELRIADFECKLRHRTGEYCRQIRNSHLVEKNWLVLPSEEARQAIASDPGLRVESSWDCAEDRMFSLVRLDAGCALCGRTFELREDGSAIGGDPLASSEPALSAITEALSLPPGRHKVRIPSGTTACPHCGWRGPLDVRAKALEVEFSGQLIRTSNHPVTMPVSSGERWSVAMMGCDLEFNLVTGETKLAGKDVTYSRVLDDAHLWLQGFPIVPAAVEALRKFHPEVMESLADTIESLDDVAALVREVGRKANR